MTIRPSSLRKAAFGLCALALAPAGVLAPVAISPATAQSAANDGNVILMSIGASRVINLNGIMSDLVIANPDVVDVHVRSQNQLFILAKAPGETAVTATTSGGKALWTGTVRVGNNLTSIDQMLKLAMPDSDITVSKMNGLFLLTGTVKAPEDAAEAERLVTAFATPPGAKPGEGITVVSRLRTATPLQVNLQVRIAEVNKSFSKSIGFNFATADLTGGFKFGLGQGRSAINDTWTIGGPLGVGNGLKPIQGYARDPNTGLFKTTKETIGSAIKSADSGTTLGADTSLFGLNILAAIDLAEAQGLAATLANPNLTALSGETASFLAGGEIPIPLSSSLGQVSVEYKQYGVSLAFTPTVLADGRISMRVRPEVSQLDTSAGVELNGFSIPGISTRRAETTVELGSGQSFVIGGLLSTSSGNSVDKAPFLGDLPVLGNLFKSRGWRRQETELVIVVTPYLVRPINASQVHLPTDGYRNATDLQGLLLQKNTDGVSGAQRPMPSVAPTTPPADPATGNPQASAVPAPRKKREAAKDKRTASAADIGPSFTF